MKEKHYHFHKERVFFTPESARIIAMPASVNAISAGTTASMAFAIGRVSFFGPVSSQKGKHPAVMKTANNKYGDCMRLLKPPYIRQ
jgi:hypothetical protein